MSQENDDKTNSPEQTEEQTEEQYDETQEDDETEEPNDYDLMEREDEEPILNTEYEHKYEMARPKINRRLIDAASMLDKELRLSRVDTDQAFIFPLYLEAANALRKLGFQESADDLNAYVKIKMSVLASVNGFERNRQTFAGSADNPIPFAPTFNQEEDENGKPKKPGIMDRLMGRQ